MVYTPAVLGKGLPFALGFVWTTQQGHKFTVPLPVPICLHHSEQFRELS